MNQGLEIHRLLKIGDHAIIPGANDAPADLPTVSAGQVREMTQAYPVAESGSKESLVPTFSGIKRKFTSKFSLLIYPVIFLVAFLFFYSVLNFQSIVAQVSGWFTVKPQAQQILGNNLSAYYDWMNGYYFAVNDQKLLDPNNDIDHDGLTNYDEFIMRTNPIVADSDKDGFTDGVEVLNSTNPWGEGPMTDTQKKLASGLDLIMINNRVSFNTSQTISNKNSVLGASTVNFDLNRSGTLSIPKLNLQVPIIWSKDPASFDADLTHGVIHYPGTALPGETGTVYISGHSSDYLWKTSPYRSVFARLNFLDIGDDIFIDIYGADGKLYNYRYQVSAKNVYAPTDQAQFGDTGVAKLNLSTCWPIGTQKSRYVVSAVLQGL